MESVALLSPTDIHVIRRYVHTKYAPLPGPRQAEIVADAIRRTLRQRLPNLPDDYKGRIVDELIMRCLVGEQRVVNPEDVLDVCSELDYRQLDYDEELLKPLLNWINERSPGRWSAEQLASRLERSSVYSVVPFPVPVTALHTETATVIEAEVRPRLPRLKIPNRAWALLASLLVSAAAVGLFTANPSPQETSRNPTPILSEPAKPDIGMPDRLKYTDIDVDALKMYLQGRDSMLSDEPYFGAIMDAAKAHDVHPVLLFAITGQEQGFVPRSNKNAKKIANNPFNVFHSWQEYNTDIRKSADIAGRTIANRGGKRPEGYEPFAWLNKTYAEDPLWQDGVRKIFDKLNSISITP